MRPSHLGNSLELRECPVQENRLWLSVCCMLKGQDVILNPYLHLPEEESLKQGKRLLTVSNIFLRRLHCNNVPASQA